MPLLLGLRKVTGPTAGLAGILRSGLGMYVTNMAPSPPQSTLFQSQKGLLQTKTRAPLEAGGLSPEATSCTCTVTHNTVQGSCFKCRGKQILFHFNFKTA